MELLKKLASEHKVDLYDLDEIIDYGKHIKRLLDDIQLHKEYKSESNKAKCDKIKEKILEDSIRLAAVTRCAVRLKIEDINQILDNQ